MVRRKETKVTALILTAVCLLIACLCSVLGGFPVEKIALYPECPLLARFAYSFFHASIIHAIINCWCLITIVFIYDVPLTYLTLSYIIAITFPVTTLANTIDPALISVLFPASVPAASDAVPSVVPAASDAVSSALPVAFDALQIAPTVGLSAVCFALMGMVSFQSQCKIFFHTWVLSLILTGYAIPYLCSVCGYSVATPNNLLHIYSYIAGLLVGVLNSPAHGTTGK